jgi:hypothetical protein
MSDFHTRKQMVCDLFAEIRAMGLTPWDYWRVYLEEAVYCYHEQRNVACILTSSATVETLLFWEYLRMNSGSITSKLREPKKGAEAVSFRTLAWNEKVGSLVSLFDKLRNTKIPLKLLLDDHEIENFNKMVTIENKARKKIINGLNYVSTRNKFAHGSIFDVVGQVMVNRFLRTGMTFEALGLTSSDLEILAYRQLTKSLRFMLAFHNEPP